MPIEINQAKRYIMKDGEQGYQEWRASLVDKPEKRAIYEEIAAKNDLWLQLVEARQRQSCR